MQTKYKLFALLISIPVSCYADKKYEFNNNQISVSGFTYYINTNTNKVIPDTYAGVLNVSVSNNYGYLTGQFSSNIYNPIRRLQLCLPVYTGPVDQLELSVGRITAPIGLINTSTGSPQLSGILLLPLSTYDPRRYQNLPDIVDGAQLSYTKQMGEVNLRIKAYGGKQVVDDPVIPVYGSNFSLQGKSEDLVGISTKVIYNNFTFKYTFTDTSGEVISTEPPEYFNYIDHTATQQIHFVGAQYNYEKFTFQSEATYRALNTTTDETGVYASVKYNIIDKWCLYTGYSYGTRIGEVSNIHDTFTGISNNVGNVTLAVEYHHTDTNNWYFDYNKPDQSTNTVLTTIVYAF